uniref:Uncharacterized protein n=1 Tax=Arundo donax TaxID=35708 RepID=A0A0A9CV00_ARUDO
MNPLLLALALALLPNSNICGPPELNPKRPGSMVLVLGRAGHGGRQMDSGGSRGPAPGSLGRPRVGSRPSRGEPRRSRGAITCPRQAITCGPQRDGGGGTGLQVGPTVCGGPRGPKEPGGGRRPRGAKDRRRLSEGGPPSPPPPSALRSGGGHKQEGGGRAWGGD